MPLEPASNAEKAKQPAAVEWTKESLEEAKRYGQISLKCDLLDMLIDIVYLSVAAFWLGPRIDAWLGGFALFASPQSYLRLAALFGILYALHVAVSFSLSYYSGFVIEHRFKLSKQTKSRWFRQYALQNVLGVAFGLVMYGAIFAVIWWVHGWWWVVVGLIFFGMSILLGQLMPVLIMPLFQKITPLDDPALLARMKKLSEGTGLTFEGLYTLGMSEDTTKANAMLAGLGRTRRVLMGDTLLEEFSPEEIDVIFAHEIGHHVHRHLPKLVAVGFVVTMLGLWVCDFALFSAASPLSVGEANQYAQFPVAALPLVMLVLKLFNIVVGPVLSALSRRFEFQSDAYALQATGDLPAFQSAFHKLALQNKADPDPHPVEVFLFHSHPSISQRLAAAERV